MIFQFKNFQVAHDRCAMKVGTDGVLLGAWTPVDFRPNRVLDVGAGSGLISLMLAQRTDALQIDAVEVDEEAFEQCVSNFENSPWNDRLFCYHASFQELVGELYEDEECYDLIISNPPFFEGMISDSGVSEERIQARFNDFLPFEDLLEGASLLLNPEGYFSLIIPYSEEEKIIQLASEFQLFPKKITRVKGTVSSKIKRSLFLFQKNTSPECVLDELILEVDRHVYTPEFAVLVKDFYLNL